MVTGVPQLLSTMAASIYTSINSITLCTPRQHRALPHFPNVRHFDERRSHFVLIWISQMNSELVRLFITGDTCPCCPDGRSRASPHLSGAVLVPPCPPLSSRPPAPEQPPSRRPSRRAALEPLPSRLPLRVVHGALHRTEAFDLFEVFNFDVIKCFIGSLIAVNFCFLKRPSPQRLLRRASGGLHSRVPAARGLLGKGGGSASGADAGAGFSAAAWALGVGLSHELVARRLSLQGT